jgi:hypothetical protein
MKAVWLLLAYAPLLAQDRVNPNSALVQDFQTRVGQYLKLHKEIKSKLPLKPTDSSSAITLHRVEFARMIREVRPQAVQGDLFPPPIATEFRRLVGLAMQGNDARRVHKSLERAEPVSLRLKVNDSYPENVPLQSTPPTLLMNLPKLPPELDYRLIGHALVLRDVDANLIVDFVPKALP